MRYFLEVSYIGTGYRGFQTQKNANTIQNEIEKGLKTLFKKKIILTGSSRTDAGVHAQQNFFHFDWPREIDPKFIYNLNAIIPGDIAVKRIKKVSADSHCRFDAISREYKYFIYREKNPFLADRAYYYPYQVNVELMQEAATLLFEYDDFTSFSKRNTQTKSKLCKIQESKWYAEDQCIIYNVRANRFLRGMVRALTSTMLKVGREKTSIREFRRIIESKDCTKASFAVPAHGLSLISVEFPGNYFTG